MKRPAHAARGCALTVLSCCLLSALAVSAQDAAPTGPASGTPAAAAPVATSAPAPTAETPAPAAPAAVTSVAPAPAAPAPEPEPTAAPVAPVAPVAPAPEPAAASDAAVAAAGDVAPEATVPAAESGEDFGSDAEFAAIMADSAGDGQASLRFYGFTDFTFQQLLVKDSSPWLAIFDDNGSFWIGNLNLYADAAISRRFRTLAEIRFLYLPNGVSDDVTPEDLPRRETAAADYSDVNRDLHWGGVEIERAWLDFSIVDALTLRIGQYLTPYGIWNVDHGSPVVVGTRRPYVIGQELFPERQTGLQAYGSLPVGDMTLGYHLTLSNGRGPVSAYRDLDANKAVGGRAYLSNFTFGRLTLGMSAYHGRYTTRADELVLKGTTDLVREIDVLTQYDETSLAGDVQWEFDGLLVQGEYIHNQRAYTDAGRPRAGQGSLFAPSEPSFARDNAYWGVYGLVGYRIAALDLMPFAYLEYVDLGGGDLLPDVLTWQLGLNYRPEAAVVIKAQFTRALSPGSTLIFQDKNLNVFETQVAWAF